MEFDDILEEELNDGRRKVVSTFAQHLERIDSNRQVRALILDSM